MGKRSFFGLEPDQLNELMSLGADAEGLPEDNQPDPDADEKHGNSSDAASNEKSPRAADAEAMKNQPTASLGGVERPGGRIGRYKLLRVLGEGGMGVVYLAEQEGQIRRKVALKVIKPGMDSKRVIARFENERQALALLDHPNIAQVYDADMTQAGRPYFAMEYVKGSPITDYCDRHRLSIEDRLDLFQQVCHAVHHAHQKGIIHRDIKPSNILVSTEGDRGVPKIIDFGVAKAIATPLTERTLFTEDTQLLGTPEYMSPEQADMAGEDVDTRSDIYSLGVLLYVLLAGILPYDSETFRRGGVEHIRKIIRETDPKTPSTRLTKLGEEAAKLAESRRTELAALAKRLHTELEWIPLKAMRKDRSERYRSAVELADDIGNYLNGTPLLAGPPGAGYRLRKFVRRNRMLVGGIAAVLVVLVAGVMVSTMYAVRLARALDENQLITEFLEKDVLGSAKQVNPDETTVIYTLDAASDSLVEGRFKDKPLVEARIRLTLGTTYTRLGEYDKGEQHIRRSTEIYRQHLGDAHPDTLWAMGSIAWSCHKQGRSREMAEIYTRILKIGKDVLSVETQVSTKNMLGAAYIDLGQYKKAELLYDEILQIVQSELGGEHPVLPWFKHNLATTYRHQGRYDKAEQGIEELIRMRMEVGPEVVARFNCYLKRSLGVIYTEQGKYAEAEGLLEEALKEIRQMIGDNHPAILPFMFCLAQLHIEQERYDDAEDLLNEALPIAREKLGPEGRFTLTPMNTYAVVLTNQKQYDRAEELFDRALKGRQRKLGSDHPDTLQTINNLGVLRREQKDYAQAKRLLRQALEGREFKLGSDHPHTLQTVHELGMLHVAQEDYSQAERLLLAAFQGRETKLGAEHPHTIDSLNQLVNLYESWPKPDEAAAYRAKLGGKAEARE
ncbi:MAG: tetratricopeptide repeat protein [Planctomycetota bacterium]|jgi:non-specific serine/threonine protein kinase/serine/threonine-protein kinase